MSNSINFVEKNVRYFTRKPLFFDVRQEPATNLFPSGGSSHCEMLNIITKDGKDKLVAAVSKGYSLTPLQNFLPKFEEELGKLYNFKVRYRVENDCKFFLDYQIPEIVIGNDKDKLCATITLCHSYNGQLRFKLLAGLFRFVCTNGLIVPVEGKEAYMKKFKKHTKSLDINYLVSSTQEAIETMMSLVPQYDKNVFQVLSDKKIENIEDRLDQIIEAVKYPVTMKDDVLTSLYNEAQQNGFNPNTAWMLYNAMNAQLIHNDKLNMRQDLVYKMDEDLVLEFLKN